MNILLHACCGPCSCYPTKELTAEGHTFTMYYFNPNIHPYKEFKRRLNTLREFCEARHYPLVADKSYPLEDTLRGMLSEPTVRCAYCYRVRLEMAARYAKEHGFDAFSTTLLVSPYQSMTSSAEPPKKRLRGLRFPSIMKIFVRGMKKALKSVSILIFTVSRIVAASLANGIAMRFASGRKTFPKSWQRTRGDEDEKDPDRFFLAVMLLFP